METKICTKCGKEKDIGKFNWRNKSKGCRNHWCKRCMKGYNEKHYRDNISRHKERSKQRYRDNKEYHNAFMKQWRTDNKEYCKKYQQNNREQVNKNSRKWKINNKDKINAYKAKRRSAKRNQIPTNADKEKISYMYQIAHEMTEERGVKYHVDHIKPLSKGGLHHENNLQILSRGLNLKKANRWPLTKEENILYAGVTIKDLKNEEETI